MPRPPKPRIVCEAPAASYFKPRGIPLPFLKETVLGLDELEALRLADLEGLSQVDVGKRMGVSRGTVGRLLEKAHRIVADALLRGKALRLEGGPVATPPRLRAACPKHWPAGCPARPSRTSLPQVRANGTAPRVTNARKATRPKRSA
jgi:predicted DNA-binding protein (UPF0251 family)